MCTEQQRHLNGGQDQTRTTLKQHLLRFGFGLWSIGHKCSRCVVEMLTKRYIRIQDDNLKMFLSLTYAWSQEYVGLQCLLRLLLVKENMSIVVVVVVGRHAMVT